MDDKGGITKRGGKGPEESIKIERITVVCPTCKTIKQVRKGTRVACDKCNRDMIEVKTDAAKKE